MKTFHSVSETTLLYRWAEFLVLQAKLCIKKDISVLTRLGLNASDHPILDFGCGAGAYTMEMKKYLVGARIVATDINESLLKIFSAKLENLPGSNIEVLKWDSKQCAPKVVKKCKTCICRLTLQHIADPKATLISLRRALPLGAKIFIIEEDDGFFQQFPELPSFSRVLDTWKRYGTQYVNDRYMGRKLPALLAGAGFHVTGAELVGHTNLDWGFDQTIDFFIGTLHLIQAAHPALISLEEIEQVKRDFIDYKNMNHDGAYVVYPQIIASAVKFKKKREKGSKRKRKKSKGENQNGASPQKCLIDFSIGKNFPGIHENTLSNAIRKAPEIDSKMWMILNRHLDNLKK